MIETWKTSANTSYIIREHLEAIFKEEWNNILLDLIENLIMSSRLQEVICLSL